MQFLKGADFRPAHTDNLARKYFDADSSHRRTSTPELGLVPTTEPARTASHNPWKAAHDRWFLGWFGGGGGERHGPVGHANDGGSIRIPRRAAGSSD
jgi:hypothetical protein